MLADNDISEGPNVETALSMSPTTAMITAESHKPTIGTRKQAPAKKGVNTVWCFEYFYSLYSAEPWSIQPRQWFIRSKITNSNVIIEPPFILSTSFVFFAASYVSGIILLL